MIPVMAHAAMPGADGKANRQLIDALLRSRLFRDYESVFTRATGLPLTLRPLEYWQLAHPARNRKIRFVRSSPNGRPLWPFVYKRTKA